VIVLDNVAKSYPVHGGGRRVVLRDVSIALPHGRNIGILGGNGAGKSTLLRLIAGSEPPDRGRVRRWCRVSFPLGFTGTFHGGLSGRENATFLARVYGADPRKVLDFIHDFSELGAYLDMPVSTFSAGMLARLAFGLTLALDFDVYLVDEVTEVGDARFRAKSAQAFRERLGRSSIILVSHSSTTIRSLCDCCAILSDGVLRPYETVEDGMRSYATLMGVEHA
jgi:capsular polysaccharide transport system ATP-binding protein